MPGETGRILGASFAGHSVKRTQAREETEALVKKILTIGEGE